ncbi:MAG: hypothetical protein KGJ66_07105 [Alphaproteobacteria bacterium]|nr:hypothetical protein [Alphaproteobacteria bacterium]
MATFFSENFGVDPAVLEKHGAFNISLVTDLPLFIDPFLLFNSKKQQYQELHERIIRYLVFLKGKATSGTINAALLKAWYCFPEVKQTWLGFSVDGNAGTGLGPDFAHALHQNLHKLFPTFGKEQITRGSHLEKLCLIREGVGRDNISDFTTNLIKGFLCEFTQKFALNCLNENQRRAISVPGTTFNYETEVWASERYTLPWINGDYVLLTPKDLLTRDDNWINRDDLIDGFEEIPSAIPDDELRAQVSNYFERVLARRKDQEPSKKERGEAAVKTIFEFPDLIDYYIRYKEEHGDEAASLSSKKVSFAEWMFIQQLTNLQSTLNKETAFYKTGIGTYKEAHTRLAYLKDVIENKGGYRAFWSGAGPIAREQDLQIMYRLVWIGTPSDVSTEVNDGRGPADFKISRGAKDKTIVELKLAKNTQLRRNLQRQAETYQKASDAKRAIKGILFFNAQERVRVTKILKELELTNSPDIVLIDARKDNKPSGSKA